MVVEELFGNVLALVTGWALIPEVALLVTAPGNVKLVVMAAAFVAA